MAATQAAAPLSYIRIEDVPRVVKGLRQIFASGRTLSVAWRKRQIQGIARLVQDNASAIASAIQADLRRPVYVLSQWTCGLPCLLCSVAGAVCAVHHVCLFLTRFESVLCEVSAVVAEAKFALANIDSWVTPYSVRLWSHTSGIRWGFDV